MDSLEVTEELLILLAVRRALKTLGISKTTDALIRALLASPEFRSLDSRTQKYVRDIYYASPAPPFPGAPGSNYSPEG